VILYKNDIHKPIFEPASTAITIKCWPHIIGIDDSKYNLSSLNRTVANLTQSGHKLSCVVRFVTVRIIADELYSEIKSFPQQCSCVRIKPINILLAIEIKKN
jgi:hypothetical protein